MKQKTYYNSLQFDSFSPPQRFLSIMAGDRGKEGRGGLVELLIDPPFCKNPSDCELLVALVFLQKIQRHIEYIKMADAPAFLWTTFYIGIVLGVSAKERALDC